MTWYVMMTVKGEHSSQAAILGEGANSSTYFSASSERNFAQFGDDIMKLRKLNFVFPDLLILFPNCQPPSA